MASTFSTNLALELIGTGDQAGTWGITTNTNLGTLIEQAISGYVTQAVATGTDTTITIPDGATGVARNMYIELTGTGGASTNLIVPANKKLYFIFNNSTGAVTVKVSGQTGVSVPAGKKMVLVSNGTDIVNAANYVADFGSNSATITQLTSTSATITNLTSTSLTLSNNPTLSGGTANGVLYLNGSKVATSGSALVFDGTNLGIGTSSPAVKLDVQTASAVGGITLTATTGTNGAAINCVNTGGSSYFGRNNSSGGAFGGTAYATVVYGGGAYPMSFYTNDTERMRLDSSGNLGIGTSSPSYQLDVVGGTRVAETAAGNGYEVAAGSTNILTSYNRTTSAWLPLRQRANQHEFYCDGVETLRLTPAGNLGLGVTPSAWTTNFGIKALQVGPSSAIVGSNNNTNVAFNVYFDGTNERYIRNGFASTYLQDSGKHIWSTAPSGTAGNAITSTTAMTLDASGRLALGRTSATDYGAGAVTLSTDGSAGSFHDFYYNGTRTGIVAGVSGEFVLDTTTSVPLVFKTVAVERARITSGGYFKASNNSTYVDAAGTFHELYQSNNNRCVEIYAANASYSADGAVFIEVNRNTTNNTFYAISYYNPAAAAYKFRVADSGNVTNTNGTYGTISDAKMKTDIVDAGSQWDDLKAVRFRKFKMKNDPSGITQLGVVAQELEQTSPGLVEEHKDIDAEGNDLGTTTKSVKTSVLLMKAAVALQEAMARIEQLEAKVAALETK